MWNVIATLLALAVGAILVVAVINMSSSGSSSSQAQTAMQNMSVVIGNIDQQYNGYPNGYANISTKSTVDGKDFPKGMIRSGTSGGGTAVNQWGAAITVAPGSNINEFVLTDPGLPTKACEAVAKLSNTNVESVSVNGTTLTSPVDPAAAAAACNKSGHGTTGGNTVAITAN